MFRQVYKGLQGNSLRDVPQWEIVEEAARVIKPARDELIRQSAQGMVIHADDTSMRVLMLKRKQAIGGLRV